MSDGERRRVERSGPFPDDGFPIKTLSALRDWPEPRDSEWVEPRQPEGAITRLIHRLTGKHPHSDTEQE